MAVTPDKVQIGSSQDFLDGVAVDTAAGTGLFRETVVMADPENGSALANVRALSEPLVGTDMGIVTHSVIQGFSTAHGGEFHDVKVTPSGALVADVTGSTVSLINGAITPKHITTSSAGETIIITPASGKAIRLWWYSLTANADNSNTVVAGLRFGTGNTDFFKQSLSKYGQGTAHSFKAGASFHQGAVNQPLIVNLDAAQIVYVNIDYEEVTP